MQLSTSRQNRSTILSKTAAMESVSNIQITPPNKSKLSYHLKNSVFTHEAPGLDLQGKTINELDDIHPSYKDLEILILDNNHLEDLQGIQQFQGLRQLSLINNQVADILNVYHLKSLPLLEELDLRGNPIASRPGYKETILLFVKNIKLLDGKTIKASDRLKIPQQLTTQYSLLDRLLRNYVEILRLQSVVQKLDLFKDLFNLNQNYIVTYVLFDLDKFRRYYNYIETIDETTRNQYRGDLLSDVRTLELEFIQKQDMQAAAQELISRQSKNIAELTHKIKQKVQALSSLYSEACARFDAYDQEEILLPSLLYPKSPFRKRFRRSVSPNKYGQLKVNETVTVNNYFNFQNNPFDSVNQSTVSLKSPVEVGKQKKKGFDSKPVHKSLIQERLYSPKKGGSPLKKSVLAGEYGTYEANLSQDPKDLLTSAYQRDLLETYQKLSSKAGDPYERRRPRSPDDLIQYISPTAHSYSPARNQNPFTMSPRSATYHLSRSGEGFNFETRQKEEGVQIFEEVITKKDLMAREEQKSQLAKNLDQKIEELLTVRDTNRDLKNKLRFLQDQNEIQVRLGKEEIEKANEELKTAEQKKKQLEVDIAFLRRNIAEIATNNSELQKYKSLLEEEREHLKKYEDQFIVEEMLEARAGEAHKWYEHKLQAKAFNLLMTATDYSKRMNEIAWRKKLREDRELMTTAFSMLKRNRIIGKIIAYKRTTISAQLSGKYFGEWKTYAKHQKIESYLTLKKQRDFQSAVFAGWKEYTDKRVVKNQVKGQLREYFIKYQKKKAFGGFKKYFDLYGLGFKAEKVLKKKAIEKNHDWVKRTSFFKWVKWVKEFEIPRKLAINAAYDHYRISLQKMGVSLLKKNFMVSRELVQKAEMLKIRRDMKHLEAVFLYWKVDYRRLCAQKRQQAFLASLFLMRTKYNIWRTKFAENKRLAYLTINAQQFYEENRKKYCFGVFLDILEKGKAALRLEEVFVRKNETQLVSNLYREWRELFLRRLRQRKLERLEAFEIKDKAWRKWGIYLNQRKEKKAKIMRAERLYAKTCNKELKVMFEAFIINAVKENKYRQIFKTVEEKKKKNIYKSVVLLLKQLRNRTLKEKIERLTHSYQEVKAEALESEEKINLVNRERLELVERVDEISEVVDSLKEENERRKRETERFEEIIRDKEKRQNKLEEEAREKRDKAEELTGVSRQLNIQMEETVRNNEKNVELMRKEKEDYNRAIIELLTDIKERDQALGDIDQENASLREKKERYLKESSQAIEDLKKELRLVKEAIKSKENEVERAMGLAQTLERRNQELRSQLHATVVDLESSTLDYRSRAKALEQKNNELLNETERLKLENERRAKEIIELGGTAKQYEFEIQYLKGGPEYKRLPQAKDSPKSAKQLSTRNEVTFRDPKLNQPQGLERSASDRVNKVLENNRDLNKERRALNGDVKPAEGPGVLQDVIVEKRRRLDQLDEKQDQIRKEYESANTDARNISYQSVGSVAESSKSNPQDTTNDNGVKKVSDNKKKIEEIKKRLEALKESK